MKVGQCQIIQTVHRDGEREYVIDTDKSNKQKQEHVNKGDGQAKQVLDALRRAQRGEMKAKKSKANYRNFISCHVAEFCYKRPFRYKAHWVTIPDSKQEHRKLSFGTDAIAAWSRDLKCPERVNPMNYERWIEMFLAGEWKENDPLPKLPAPKEPRERFAWTCYRLEVVLNGIAEDHGSASHRPFTYDYY